MAIEPQDWQSGDSYPAARMTELEGSVSRAHSAAASAQSTADGKADPSDIPSVSSFVTQSDIDSAVEGLASQSALDDALSRIAALEADSGDDGAE